MENMCEITVIIYTVVNRETMEILLYYLYVILLGLLNLMQI